jgi:hypothetical protein
MIELVKDDSYAITFQSMWKYRLALLERFALILEQELKKA